MSGLLIATSFLKGTTQLTVTDPGEKPWIDLTLSWLKRLGGQVVHENYERYTIQGHLRYNGFEMTIPGDFSSAAFPLVAAILTNSTLTLENLDYEDSQGDKKIVEILKEMGAHLEIHQEEKRITVRAGPVLKGITIDANAIIDAVPILAVLGCFSSGKMEITNAAIARKKESDRLHAISTELRKMGAQIEEREEGLIIHQAHLKGASLNSHADHRIAMALAVAAMGAKGSSTIHNCGCIAKSYPSFVDDFRNLGAEIHD